MAKLKSVLNNYHSIYNIFSKFMTYSRFWVTVKGIVHFEINF